MSMWRRLRSYSPVCNAIDVAVWSWQVPYLTTARRRFHILFTRTVCTPQKATTTTACVA